MNAGLLYLTLVSEMPISLNGLPGKLTHAAPLSALTAFFTLGIGTWCGTVSHPAC